MGTQFPDIVIGSVVSSPQSQTHIIMFRFVALFALVAVAAAEPQWAYANYGYAPVMDATHMKTASGDTVSVAAHKAQHHQLKAAEYAKKGYAFGYVKPAVASYAAPVASYAAPVATYAAHMPYTYAGVHHLGKREAEADSPNVYSGVYNTVASPVVYNNAYNGVYNGVYNGLYNTYAGVHHLGKREAEADSQFVYNTYGAYPYTTGYTGYTGYNGYTGYTTPYTYGNMWNRYHF